jgi:hypothetical protein
VFGEAARTACLESGDDTDLNESGAAVDTVGVNESQDSLPYGSHALVLPPGKGDAAAARPS